MFSPPPFEHFALGIGASALDLGRSGQFNQTHWRVDASGDHTDVLAQLLSLHEWTHNELNNVSVYGCLLTVFAQLALHAKADRDHYREVLGGLVERSRRAHEIYATWYSTDMFLLRAKLPELLDEYSSEYISYFEAGTKLVQDIDSPFLRQQAFLCAVRICFSTAALAHAGRDLVGFALADVGEELYPSAILNLLTKQLPAGFFDTQLAAFYGSHESASTFSIVQAACAEPRRDAEFFPGVIPDEADAATMALHRWLHGRLADLLAAHAVDCTAYGDHLAYFAELLPQLTRLCEGSGVTHPLVASTRPYDNAVNLLLHMENEVLYVRRKPWPCRIRTFTEVATHDWTKLAAGDPAHLFFCVRYPSQIVAQHDFSQEDREWLESITEPLVFVRRKVQLGESTHCEIILFDRPDTLRDFRRATHDVAAYSSIAMSVLGNSGWCDRWLEACTDDIIGTILFDQSVFHTLKDAWPQHLKVRYCKGVLTGQNGRHVFLVFLCESTDDTYALYLAPCSEMFMRALSAFVRQRLAPEKFVYDETFMRELDWLLPPVVDHLVVEEQFFSFNQIRFT